MIRITYRRPGKSSSWAVCVERIVKLEDALRHIAQKKALYPDINEIELVELKDRS